MENKIKKLWEQICEGDRRSIAKGITLLESNKLSDETNQEELLNFLCKKEYADTIRICISGITGAGKSSLIEKLGIHFIQKGKKVAVLAVDPSSPLSGGSILGDKTRMEKLANHQDAFVRPSPNKANAGGLSISTKESILLLENAGYEVIFIETVGVGQSEYIAHSLVDLFLVLLLPSAGDDLQGSKKGITELADLILINKADQDLLNQAKITLANYQEALGEGKVILGSTIKKSTFENVISSLEKLIINNENKKLKIRQKQKQEWIKQAIQKKCHSMINKYLDKNKKVIEQTDHIYQSAQEILNKILKK